MKYILFLIGVLLTIVTIFTLMVVISFSLEIIRQAKTDTEIKKSEDEEQR